MGRGSDGNKVVLNIPQSSCNTGSSVSDCLVSYAGNSLGEFYPSAEMQLMYSAAPADWASSLLNAKLYNTRTHPSTVGVFYSPTI